MTDAQNAMRNSMSIIVSLGSTAFSVAGLRDLLQQATCLRPSQLIVCLLDQPEELNLRYIYGLGAEQAALRVAERTLRLQEAIRGSRVSAVMTICLRDALSTSTALKHYVEWLTSVRRANRAFADACDNQVYRNLHPILQRLGVRNRRHPLVQLLAPYLVIELATKLFLADEYGVHCEVAPNEEMPLTREVFAGTFGTPEGRPLPRMHSTVVVDTRYGRDSLAVDRVGFAYRQSSTASKDFALQPFSLQVPAGRILGILGPSGCGKSTILRLIAGHLKPTSGCIRLGDVDITAIRPGRRGVLTVFQDYALFEHLSVEDNIAFGLKCDGTLAHRAVRLLVTLYLTRFDLLNKRAEPPRLLSAGERQRVAIARALIMEPQVLLLDEPTAAQDHLRKASLSASLAQMLNSPPVPAVVIVSHDRDFIFSLCDKIAIVEKGVLLACTTREDLVHHPPSIDIARLLGTHGCIMGRRANAMFCFVDLAGRERAIGPVPAAVSGMGRAALLVPPAAVRFSSTEQAAEGIPGVITARSVHGERVRVTLRVQHSDSDNGVVSSDLADDASLADWTTGHDVLVTLILSRCHVCDV